MSKLYIRPSMELCIYPPVKLSMVTDQTLILDVIK